MSFLIHLLFESPLWLGTFSFLLFAGMLFARQRWESEFARRYAIPTTLLIIGLLFVIQRLTVTQREEIHLALDAFVSAIEREDTSAIEEVLARDYAGEGMDRQRFAEYVASRLEDMDIRDARLTRRDLDMDDDSAAMTLAVKATVSFRGRIGQFHWASWHIAWQREAGDWKIVSVRPKSVDGQSVDTLRALNGSLP